MSFNTAEWIIRIAVLLFAVTIHEYAHGKAALSLGDPTAKNAGRLTLNPISHIDPIGAICLFLFNFGWAKPVPVNTRYFQNRRRDTILMAISGPVSNISAAFVTGLFLRFYLIQVPIYQTLLIYMLLMNIGLGLFNLLPIPPLDGSHVLENILPPSASIRFRQMSRYAPFVLIGVLLLDNFLHMNILGRLLAYPILKIAHLFGGDNFYRLIGFL
ncbi:site-2 protease family protein [Deltaproteobacteria bacterium]|nr:site-2 protease family protein [Deltaproteobacteria bacterium]